MTTRPMLSKRHIHADQILFWAKAKGSTGSKHAWKGTRDAPVTVCGTQPGAAPKTTRPDMPAYGACSHCVGYLLVPVSVSSTGQVNLPLLAATVAATV